MGDRDLPQSWHDLLVSIHTFHPVIDVAIGILLVLGGVTLFALLSRRISLGYPATRSIIFVVGSGLIIGGIDELAYSFSFVGNPPGDEFALLEYMAAFAILSFTLVGLPWLVLRMTLARKTIESLRGQIADTGRVADEVRAQQRELSQRYAARSSALSMRSTRKAGPR